jgi:hypothetical protein
MTPPPAVHLGALRPALQWLAGWWQVIHLGAVMGVLALSASGRRQAWGSGLAGQVYRASGPMLAGFTIATAVLSLVVIRIVIVTAQSYGLSQYALEMVVRVLVLELIPLAAHRNFKRSVESLESPTQPWVGSRCLPGWLGTGAWAVALSGFGPP